MSLNNLNTIEKDPEKFLQMISADKKAEVFELFRDLEEVKQEDFPEIVEFLPEFKDLSDKYGKFTLKYKSSWARWKIFELLGENGSSFVVKIPYIDDIKNPDMLLEKMVEEEFLQHSATIQLHQDLLQEYKWKPEEKLLKMIKIPIIHRSTLGKDKLIFMEKLTGETVRYNAVSAIFSPWSQKFNERKRLHNATDMDIELKLIMLENDYPKECLFDEGMLNAYPDITVSEILDELMIERPFNGDLFEQIFPENPEKGKMLKDAYNFFNKKLQENNLAHPDPHPKNYMITDEWELGVLDFWKDLIFH